MRKFASDAQGGFSQCGNSRLKLRGISAPGFRGSDFSKLEKPVSSGDKTSSESTSFLGAEFERYFLGRNFRGQKIGPLKLDPEESAARTSPENRF
jgi:hypothetical protein